MARTINLNLLHCRSSTCLLVTEQPYSRAADSLAIPAHIAAIGNRIILIQSGSVSTISPLLVSHPPILSVYLHPIVDRALPQCCILSDVLPTVCVNVKILERRFENILIPKFWSTKRSSANRQLTSEHLSGKPLRIHSRIVTHPTKPVSSQQLKQ